MWIIVQEGASRRDLCAGGLSGELRRKREMLGGARLAGCARGCRVVCGGAAP